MKPHPLPNMNRDVSKFKLSILLLIAAASICEAQAQNRQENRHSLLRDVLGKCSCPPQLNMQIQTQLQAQNRANTQNRNQSLPRRQPPESQRPKAGNGKVLTSASGTNGESYAETSYDRTKVQASSQQGGWAESVAHSADGRETMRTQVRGQGSYAEITSNRNGQNHQSHNNAPEHQPSGHLDVTQDPSGQLTVSAYQETSARGDAYAYTRTYGQGDLRYQAERGYPNPPPG